MDTENNNNTIDLKEIDIDNFEEINKYYMLRRTEAADSNIIALYLWKDCYPTKYFTDDKGLMWVAVDKDDDSYYSTVPCCKKEDLVECFNMTQKYFNDILGQKLVLYVVDKEAIDILDLPEDKYEIKREAEHDDYIYDANKLRTLSGKKYHKKKNHLNAFIREYEDRCEFRELGSDDKNLIINFLKKWVKNKENTEMSEYIDYEIAGTEYIIDNLNVFANCKMAGVFIDGVLEAFTFGAYYEEEDMVYIPVEKANVNIRGLYTYINYKFLNDIFVDAAKVNREDDMGLEGLRKAKKSYNPIYMVEKYIIIQK